MNRLPLLILLIIVIISGCTQSSPVVPPRPSSNGTSATSTAKSGHVLWGLWQVIIDSENMTVDVVPLRGAEFTCNVTKFMQPPISPTNLVIKSIGIGSLPADGYFEVDVGLQHPFPGLKRFSGFDVRGILMTNGSTVGSYDNSVIIGSADDTRLLNPDGYTRWWNYSEFTSYNTIFGYTEGKLGPSKQLTATVNPYKYFALGLGKDDPVTSLDPASRGFFPTDAGVLTRTYKIQFLKDGSQTLFNYQYAVDASWAAPDSAFEPDYPVEAFPPEANVAEAYHMSATDAGSTAYFVDQDTKGGKFTFDLEIFDRQGNVNPGGVPGEVSAIWLESDALASPVNALSGATIVPGSTVVSSVFEVNLTSLNLTKSGTVDFFATIESASPSTYEPEVSGGNSFNYPDAHLAAFFAFSATVGSTAPPQGSWHFDTIDSGTFHSNRALDIDSTGHPRICYRSYPDGNLKYAYHDGAQWNYITSAIPIASLEGMKLDTNNTPHIVFSPNDPMGVTWGNYDGTDWQTTDLYTPWPGTSSSITVDSLNHPHLAIHGGGGPWGVFHKWFDGSSWQSEQILGGNQLIDPSIDRDSLNNMHIMTFLMYSPSFLYHLYNTPGSWTADGLEYPGNAVSLRIDKSDNLHIAFGTGAGGDPVNNMAYSYNDGSGWSTTVIDTSSDLRLPSITVDSLNHPHISYWDVSAKSLKYAYNDGASWHISTLVASDVGWRSSIGILPGDHPCIAYMNLAATTIYYAWFG
jgi:hypothetical protein